MLHQRHTYQTLRTHYERIKNKHLRTLFAENPNRFDELSLEAAGLFLDYSKNRLTAETRDLLVRLAEESGLAAAIEGMFTGEKLNRTEQRAVLHTALRYRGKEAVRVDGEDVMPEVRAVLRQMADFSTQLHAGEWRGHTGQAITDVVNIGIGGSDLGPHMVTEALRPYHHQIRVHFVSNVDAAHLLQVLQKCHPETTLFLIASKSFTTQETMTNAHTARRWLLGTLGDEAAIARHFVAISTNTEAVEQFGIPAKNMFRFRDWVGGRFSLWSAIGLSICCAIGYERFEELLNGAYDMDIHFRTAPFAENMPVLLALIGIWYANFFKTATYAILPYDQSLHLFPAYLQQTDMESNGKSFSRSGVSVSYPTAPVIWGQAGTNGQHAFYQLIHQGTQLVPADFIAPISPQHHETEHHQILLAHCLAQTEALMNGKTEAEVRAEIGGDHPNVVYRTFRGNVPSNTLLLPKLTPRYLGSLIALYEHKIFTQGVLWDIFSFDQWGVELGKQLAKTLLAEIQGASETAHDGSTSGLLHRIRG